MDDAAVKVWVSFDATGVIDRAYRGTICALEPKPGYNIVQIEDKNLHETLITKAGHACYMKNDRLSIKKEVRLRVNKRVAEADGKDSVKISFDLPEDIQEASFRIGENLVKVQKGEDLEITWNDKARVAITVENLELTARPVFINFVRTEKIK